MTDEQFLTAWKTFEEQFAALPGKINYPFHPKTKVEQANVLRTFHTRLTDGDFSDLSVSALFQQMVEPLFSIQGSKVAQLYHAFLKRKRLRDAIVKRELNETNYTNFELDDEEFAVLW